MAFDYSLDVATVLALLTQKDTSHVQLGWRLELSVAVEGHAPLEEDLRQISNMFNLSDMLPASTVPAASSAAQAAQLPFDASHTNLDLWCAVSRQLSSSLEQAMTLVCAKTEDTEDENTEVKEKTGACFFFFV